MLKDNYYICHVLYILGERRLIFYETAPEIWALAQELGEVWVTMGAQPDKFRLTHYKPMLMLT